VLLATVLLAVVGLFSCCICPGILIPGSNFQAVGSTPQPPLGTSVPARDNSNGKQVGDTKDNGGGNKPTDPQRAEEIARKAKEEAEKQAQAQAEAEVKRKADAERIEKQMVEYELAKVVYHASSRLALGRKLAADAEAEALRGHDQESRRLADKAKTYFKEVVDRYPDTEAADDAKQLLDGKDVPRRVILPRPSLPTGAVASEDDLADKAKPPPGVGRPFEPLVPGSIAIPPGISVKIVLVRAYSRQDGTAVAAHYRTLSEVAPPP
jgi:hypothetical protein